MIPNTIEMTIPSGETISDIIDIGTGVIAGLILPALTSCDLTFEVSARGETPIALKTGAGVAVSITAGTGGFAVESDSLVGLAGWRLIRVISSVAQAGERILLWVLKG